MMGKTCGKGKGRRQQLTFKENVESALCNETVCIVFFFRTANPAVVPVQQDQLIAANVGDSVSIEFKISSLPEVMPSNIKWFHENNLISATENLSEDRRSLVIDNVQLSDAGHYQVEVCVSSQCEVQHTNLSVTGEIFHTVHEVEN